MNGYKFDNIVIDDWREDMTKAELLQFIEALEEATANRNQIQIEAIRHDLETQHITQEAAISQLLNCGLNNLKIVELFEQWGKINE